MPLPLTITTSGRVSTGFLGASLVAGRQISIVNDMLLQSLCGQITSCHQDSLIMFVKLFPKEFHLGTCCVGNNTRPFQRTGWS
jgi:hypothetical protein